MSSVLTHARSYSYCFTWKVMGLVRPMSPKEHQLTSRARKQVPSTSVSVCVCVGSDASAK